MGRPLQRQTLRPAAVLTAEREARRTRSAKEAFDGQMSDITQVIEDAHLQGQKEVTTMTFIDTVKTVLEANGYKVSLQKAMGMGDVDSYRIQWE